MENAENKPQLSAGQVPEAIAKLIAECDPSKQMVLLIHDGQLKVIESAPCGE